MTVPLPASTGKASSAPAIAFIIAIARGTGGCIDSVVTETSRTVKARPPDELAKEVLGRLLEIRTQADARDRR